MNLDCHFQFNFNLDFEITTLSFNSNSRTEFELKSLPDPNPDFASTISHKGIFSLSLCSSSWSGSGE